ncbi:MAG TPA: hydantoinase B/oxoprolinase family protein [Candidatus Limnocylindria bacterium]|nr:hydantoinase B/oxoprolinase family protein [Candidatus Limnocylindria bacterium]
MIATLDPITAEIIGSALVYASEEMGIAVRNASYSPNIKERLDHSCALFDRGGRLIAQAEHIPVHLGSLPWGLGRIIETIAAAGEAMRPGDMWVANDPYISGTHLNDVTVVRPIFHAGTLIGYAANKAHHTDVGGSVPGSMPPDARELFQEGLIVPPMRLMRNDEVVAETVVLFRANSRTPESRSGDLRAQIAGNTIGERRVLELVERYGVQTYEAATDKALHDSEVRMRAALRTFPDGEVRVEDVLEDASGEPSIHLRLLLTKRGDEVTLDYAGTNAQLPLPLNGVYGVTLSAVYYALRAVTDATIPMNDGVFRPVHVEVPLGTILNPRRPAAVSGGNVETSQRNADLVLAALAALAPDRVPAQSGGSMHNVMLGGVDGDGNPWAFYETNGCGQGGRPNADGIDAIQAHMTNTLNTPIEAIERTFPLRVTRYEFAEGTAGDGRFRGGSGLVRAMQLRSGQATIALLAERHTVRPRGSVGGAAGGVGRHHLVTDGVSRELPAKTTLPFTPGETLVVQTAGGGGYGNPDDRDDAARERDARDGIRLAPFA